MNPFSSDPRRRWVIGMNLIGEDGEQITINLCPKHAAEALHLDEDFYQRTERTEQFVREHAMMN
jgi:hypothetical protein